MSLKSQLKEYLYFPNQEKLLDIIDNKLSEVQAKSILNSISKFNLPMEIEEISFSEEKSGLYPMDVKYIYGVTYLN